MRPITSFHRLAAATAAFLAAHYPAGAAAPREAKPAGDAALQVIVDVPPAWSPFLEDDVAEAFAYRLQETFRRQGFVGSVAHVHRLDEPVAQVPVIEIQLTEWRIDRAGQALCSFNALLRTPQGEKRLGRVTDSAIFWPSSGGRWGIQRRLEASDALEDAAERALRDLYERVAKSDLLPGAKLKR
ncbi:MAG TPA: hypothetical protein VEB66_04370 [Opitutaceae bacterium]|nr:hypothetical protein [Opitutaceae bacterium]